MRALFFFCEPLFFFSARSNALTEVAFSVDKQFVWAETDEKVRADARIIPFQAMFRFFLRVLRETKQFGPTAHWIQLIFLLCLDQPVCGDVCGSESAVLFFCWRGRRSEDATLYGTAIEMPCKPI